MKQETFDQPWPVSWWLVSWTLAEWVNYENRSRRVVMVWNQTRLAIDVEPEAFRALTGPLLSQLRETSGFNFDWQVVSLPLSEPHRLTLLPL